MTVVKQCLECGADFETDDGHSWQKYCCSSHGKRYRRKHNQNHAFICQGCGEKYRTAEADRDKYCSRECFFEHNPNIEMVEWDCLSCGRHMETTTTEATGYCSDECKEKGSALECEWCGSEFFSKYGSLYCSDDCSDEAKRDRSLMGSRARFYAAWPIYECAECGCEFRPAYGDKRRSFCSLACSKRFENRKYHGVGGNFNQRARKMLRELYGVVPPLMYEPVRKWVIFKRDNWTCGICGEEIDRSLEWFDEMYPTIDHVVALSNGGAHRPENMQAAHLMCNSYKGAEEASPVPRGPHILGV